MMAGGLVTMGVVASQVGLTVATGGLYGLVAVGVYALGGVGIEIYQQAKESLEFGRQRLRGNWIENNGGYGSDASLRRKLPNLVADEWNEVLNFRVKRGLLGRRGFTEDEQRKLTHIVMKSLENGTPLKSETQHQNQYGQRGAINTTG